MLPPARNVGRLTRGYLRDWDNEVSQLTNKSYYILTNNKYTQSYQVGNLL
jgi:hypothetical protein